MTMRVWSLFFLILMILGHACPAEAHPHAWIALKTIIYVNENGEATAIREYWQFDKMYSAYAMKKFGSNGDKDAKRKALLQLAQNNLSNLKDNKYYTVIMDDDGNPVVLGDPKDISADFVGVVESEQETAEQKKMVQDMIAQTKNYPPEAQKEVQKYVDAANAKTQIAMEFTLPFQVPQNLRDHSITYRIYDPTYYTDVEHLPDGNVVFVNEKDGSSVGSCSSTIQLPKIDANMLLNAAALDTSPGAAPQDLGYSFSEKVTLSCSQQKP